jgi:diaminohydroxyphosphoribosylaminopyrimidine deaminase/5-amino-6-(5-phosphoribosylamino)uracil reductase
LIGGGTLNCDDPSLSVRLVKGDNPVKILVGSKDYDKGKIELGSELIEVSSNSLNSNLQACFKDDKLNCKDLLKFLFDEGVCSVYIEGGSKTTSSFINANAIDVVQIHIAPIILGSGITGFTLPEVKEICDGIKYSDFKFHRMGNEIMFTGSKNQSCE